MICAKKWGEWNFFNERDLLFYIVMGNSLYNKKNKKKQRQFN